MKDAGLWQAVNDLVTARPEGHVEILATRLENLPAAPSAGAYVSLAESALYNAWQRSRLPGTAVAAALRAAAFAAAARDSRETTDLVWTGPETSEVPVRLTEVVLLELIAGAVYELTVVSFVAYEVPSLVQALREAAHRGVDVKVILEAPTTMGGGLDTDSVAKIRAAVPEARVFVWRRPDGTQGVVHAKCMVADGRTALVTSANITSAAMRRNMELGVLLQGGRHPGRLQRHFAALIDSKVLVEIR